MDHRGGLRSVLRQFNVTDIYSGEPKRIKSAMAEKCLAGQKWHWDGVDFEVLHPSGVRHWRGNNASCVLRVSNRGGRLLITGDIELAAEKWLTRHNPNQLQADVVTVPHHGSKSSSSNGFVNSVGSGVALVSAGYRNHYGFPKDEVMTRWQVSGASVLNSFDAGAVSIYFSKREGISTPESFRDTNKRYWMDE